MSLTLVVLAAGLGSRFGGLKQLEPVGPGGATLMDYSVFDALRAGFRRVAFVIRPEMADAFDRSIGDRYRGRVEVAIACQRLDELPAGAAIPPGRTRPWGTTQAVLAAGPLLSGPFAVLNADDFYGRDALAAVGRFLGEAAPDTCGVVGYRLEQTASAAGGVNRAVLEQAGDGSLTGIVEVHNLLRVAEGRFQGEVGGAPRIVAADALVSMNLWALTPSVLPKLAAGFKAFLRRGPGLSGEYYLPSAVQELLAAGSLRVKVLPTTSRWCGMTHPADRPWVEATLRELVAAGEYPAQL
jgi:NDP-sugar pyrophosphorylase family protein